MQLNKETHVHGELVSALPHFVIFAMGLEVAWNGPGMGLQWVYPKAAVLPSLSLSLFSLFSLFSPFLFVSLSHSPYNTLGYTHTNN